MVEGPEIPTLVLGSVSNGSNAALLYPDQVGPFFLQHWDCAFVAHNLAFDYWVLSQATGIKGLQDLVDEGRFCDSMLLDQLLQLARVGKGGSWEFLRAKNLGLIAQEYCGLKVDKADPYRLRYEEILGVDFKEVDSGFLDYAIGDAIVLWKAIGPMLQEAKLLQGPMTPRVQDKTYDIYRDAQRRFGLLSNTIQTKTAVVLAEVYRRGIGVNSEKVTVLGERLKGELDVKVSWIKENYPQLFSYYKIKARAGQFMVNKNTQVPKLKVKELKEVLKLIPLGPNVVIPRTPKTHDLSTSLDVWRDAAPDHPLVKNWTEMSDLGKLLQFCFQLKDKESVHPRYHALVRTGRTSCTTPNIQQMPKEAHFRDCFMPRSGFMFAAIDFSFIELRTLASVCLAKYGSSRLGDVIVGGVDPHVHTASMLVGMSLEDFQKLKDTHPDLYKKHRQAAKAVNFGVPGGLGAAKLVLYAKTNYGVTMTLEEARRFKDGLCNRVYPELGWYLTDGSLLDLANNLKTHVGQVKAALKVEEVTAGLTMGGVKKIVGGRAFKADGTPFNSYWVSNVWNALVGLDASEDARVREVLSRQEGSPWLEERLFSRTVATLTGRLRSGVSYTEARNTPFQGLAADGAKLALWGLHKAGFRIVAFIHDEVLLEVKDEEEAKEAQRIMDREMKSVLHPLIPCASEYHYGTLWEKP